MWNAAVSGALLTPLHVCEVSIRNAVADVLEDVYGPRWPWEPAFERSLPNPVKFYSPRKDLITTRHAMPTTGKVIPELKFVFWQRMFTGRHDTRLWNNHLLRVMPNLDAAHPAPTLRLAIYTMLEQVRRLRNRIAHYEPVFSRDLSDDYRKILELVTYRCAITASWLDENQHFTKAVTGKP